MEIHIPFLVGFLLACTSIVSSSIVDQTLEEKAIGQAVVFATVSKIQNSFIFPDDSDLLKRIALVESEFGDSPNTFPPSFYGGIWQLSDAHYQLTKDTSLSAQHAEILLKYKIDWLKTSWTDLLKPLYSGLAARLYLHKVGKPIPQTLDLQAAHWKQFYSNEAEDTVQKFIDTVKNWESGSLCKGKMDLLVVLDESGSIGQPSFTLALEFVAQLFATYSLENVRQGFLTFSTDNRIIFPIDNQLTAEQIKSTVLNLNYVAGGTNTNKGILGAVQMFQNVAERPGIPKIMTLFTDGQSTDGEGLSNVALLKAEGITSFAIGISNYLEPELITIAYGDRSHVFKITDFQALTEFFHRLNSETCDIPQKPSLNETISEEVEKNERRIYQFTIPANGINVLLSVNQGSVSTYYSYTVDTPSSAIHDGVLSSEHVTYIHPSYSKTVYVAVEGLEDINQFVLMGFASVDAPDFGSGGRCQIQGVSGHSNDCSLYHDCDFNEVGDLWNTVRQCPNDQVWCEDKKECGSVAVCPCDTI